MNHHHETVPPRVIPHDNGIDFCVTPGPGRTTAWGSAGSWGGHLLPEREIYPGGRSGPKTSNSSCAHP